MATREENLKKINDELEKLDDEELEKVAGGLMPHGLRGIQGQRRNEKLSDDELEKVAGGFYARYNGGEFEKDQAALKIG